jgi:Spy/CpxP family protein refolding chaperone
MQNYLKDSRSQMEVLRNDTTLTPEQRRTQVRQIRETTQARLRSVLTPAQQAKAEELRAQARQKMEERRQLAADRRLERMTTELGLSASQGSAIKSITEQARNQAKTIRENSALTQEQKIQQLQTLRTDTRNQIASNLTPEQKTKLEQLRQQAGNRFEQRRRRGGAGPRGPRSGGAPIGLSL